MKAWGSHSSACSDPELAQHLNDYQFGWFDVSKPEDQRLRAQVEAHLGVCPSCAEDYRQFGQMTELLVSNPALVRKVEAAEARARRFSWGPLKPVLAVAALVLLLIGAPIAYRQHRETQFYRYLSQVAPLTAPPYHSEELRGHSLAVPDPLETAMKPYWMSRWAEADTLLSRVLEGDPQWALAEYYQGGARLMQGHYAAAAASFRACLVHAGDAQHLREDAQWYLALSLLYNKESQAARQELLRLAQTGRKPRKQDAENLLRRIETAP